MDPLQLIETTPGNYSLLLNAGDTSVEEVIEAAGHEGNGYFWAGVVAWLVAADPSLTGFGMDPEGGMFVAYGTDRSALERLGSRLAELANGPDAMAGLLEAADAAGHDFDD